MDYNISDRDQLRGRYVQNKVDQLDDAANLPAFWTTLPQRFYLASLAEFHNFSPNLTNELRLAYNRFSQFYVVPPFKFPGTDVYPNITIDDLFGANIGPDGNAPQYSIQNTYQLVENLNWIKGNHTLKFGYDGRNSISPQHFIQRERGDYYWLTLESYLKDEVPGDFAERNLGSTSYYGNQWANYLYVNDTWRLRPNFTLNLGLRWERTSRSADARPAVPERHLGCAAPDHVPTANNRQQEFRSAGRHRVLPGQERQHLHSCRVRHGV